MKKPDIKKMKLPHKIVPIILVVLVILVLMKDVLIKSAVESGASFVAGAQVKITSLSFGLATSKVEIKGFRLYNPPGYPHEVMVDIPLVRVVYDLPAILTGHLHLPEMTVNLDKVVLIKDKQGRLNVDALKVAQQKEEPASQKPKQKQAAAKQMPMQLDHVNLNLGKVIVKDYSQGEPPSILAYDIGVRNKKYEKITSAQQLATLILTNAMGPTALKSAGIYAAASVLGVAFLPAGVAGVLIGKDSATDTFKVDRATAYQKAKAVLASAGEITQEKSDKGIIQARIKGADVTLSLTEKDRNLVEVRIESRKLMIPRPEVAEGILYQLSEQLNGR